MSDNYGAQRWVSFFNDSGETIPSYALLMFVSDQGEPSTTKNFARRLRAKRYQRGIATQFKDQGVYAFNSRAAVANGEYGKCSFAIDGPAWARLKDTEYEGLAGGNLDADNLWLGEEVGPLDDKWSVGPKSHGGFIMLSRPIKLADTNYHRALVIAKNRTRRKVQSQADTFLGNRDFGGVAYEGQAGGFGQDYTVNCEDYPLLIAPGQLFWIEWDDHQENWKPVQGGQDNFRIGHTLEDINPSGNAIVGTWSDAGEHGIYEPNTAHGTEIEVVIPITGEPVPADTDITVGWDSVSRLAYITGTGCTESL